MQIVHCLLFFSFLFYKDGAYVSFPEEWGGVFGGRCFYICHSSINTHTHTYKSGPASRLPPAACLHQSLSSSLSLSPLSLSPSPVYTFPTLKCEMRGGSQDNWPCVSRVVWSRNAAEATHLRAAQQTVKCSTGGRTRLQRERGTRAV